MALNHRAQFLRRSHLDLVSPLIEMPGHFQPACCMEPDDQAAIFLWLQYLPGMEAESRGTLRRFWCKAPDHFAILRGILPDTKCPGGIFGNREPILKRETLIQGFSLMDQVDAEIAYLVRSRRIPRCKVSPMTKEDPVRLQNAR